MVLYIEGPSFPSLDWVKPIGQYINNNPFTILGQPIYTSVPQSNNLKSSISEEAVNSTEREKCLHTIATSKNVWDGGLILSKYLEYQVEQGKINLKNKKVIELGSGQGILGLSCSALGANVRLTDAPEAVTGLKSIISINHDITNSLVKASSLDWNLPVEQQSNGVFNEEKYDILVAADVVWVDWLVEPLVRTISTLMTKKPVIGYLAYQPRGKQAHQRLFQQLEQHHINFELIPTNQLHPQYQKGDTVLLYKLSNES